MSMHHISSRILGRLCVLLIILLGIGCDTSEATSTPQSLIKDNKNEIPIENKNFASAAVPLENTPWVLTSFPRAQLNPLLDVNQVTIHFAIEGGSVSGKSTCNDYFATYELAGSSLIIRKLGILMMTCDEEKMRVENAFFESLVEVSGYQIDGESLTLMNDAQRMVLRFKVAPYTKSANFTRDELANAEYKSDFLEFGLITLKNSEFRSGIETSVSQLIVQLTYHMAFGDLDSDGFEEAVVVLVSNTGSSTVFYDLAVVKKIKGELYNIANTPLGGRVLVRDIVIDQGTISIDMLVPSTDHITCCPDAPVNRQYRLDGDQLVLED